MNKCICIRSTLFHYEKGQIYEYYLNQYDDGEIYYVVLINGLPCIELSEDHFGRVFYDLELWRENQLNKILS